MEEPTSGRAGEPDLEEQARTLRVVLRGGAGVLAVALVASIVLRPASWANHYGYVALLLDHLIALGLVRLGHPRLAVVVFTVVCLISVLSAMVILGGLHAPAGMAVLPLVLLVGFTWSERAALMTALAASLGLLALALLEISGLMPPPRAQLTPVRIWIVATSCLIVTAVILGVALQHQRRARARALAHERERAAMERALQRSQRLEALGTLAAGVAHDFSNVLTVVSAQASLARAGKVPVQDSAQAIEEAVERANALTRQLLAFARRQKLEPQLLDLAAVVRDLDGLLRRLLEPRARLVIGLGATEPISADRSQIEQVVLNLVTNARDAITDGGVVTVRVGMTDAAGGAPRRVFLAVEDTGSGMDAAVASRVFEPFFTTKDPGRGTGLGLATVHGIVTQSGGEIGVRSDPGVGTTFTAFLPVAADRRPDVAPRRPADGAAGHS